MDSIISGKMTAELIGGVSDINTANGDMLFENGMDHIGAVAAAPSSMSIIMHGIFRTAVSSPYSLEM